MNKPYLTLGERTAYHSLEDVVGCKWSAGVVVSIGRGIRRPGELERHIPGIFKKILNERLRKLSNYHLIERIEIPGTIRHIEYHLTPAGKKLAQVIEQLHQLNREHAGGRIS